MSLATIDRTPHTPVAPVLTTAPTENRRLRREREVGAGRLAEGDEHPLASLRGVADAANGDGVPAPDLEPRNAVATGRRAPNPAREASGGIEDLDLRVFDRLTLIPGDRATDRAGR